MDQQNPDYLQDLENEIYLEPVSAGIRFANYIIDVIAFYIVVIIIGGIWGVLVVARGGTLEDIQAPTNNGLVVQYLIGAVLVVMYWTLFEGATKGRTLGKLITKTVAVKIDGTPITFKEAFLRSLCRVIPLEPFSAFGGRPWHDTITKTMVIKKTK